MSDYGVTWHPAIKQVVEAAIELDEERSRAAAVLGPETFERARGIVEGQNVGKRAAFYGTISEAACAGEDFSCVESIQDIARIYAHFAVHRALGQ